MTNELERKFPIKLDLQLFAEGDDDPVGDPPQDPPAPKKLELTQEEFDAKIAERLARERKKYHDYDDVKTKLTDYEKAEEERKRADMTERERLEAEKAEALKKAQEAEEGRTKALESANNRLVKAEFKLIAKELGVKPEALDDAFVLANRQGITVDDEGNVQGAKEAVESLRESKPYLFGSKQYGDPSPGNPPNPRRDAGADKQAKLKELADIARRTGRIEDKIAYADYKREIES